MNRTTAAKLLVIAILAASTTVQAQDRGRGRGRGQNDGPDRAGRAGPPGQQVSAEEQRRRAQEEQQRAAQYRQHLDEQVKTVQRQTEALRQQQQRAAQYRAQQEYAARLREQQTRLQAQRDYSHDPYTTTPHTYRYTIRGTARQTNQYGADVLRQAVNYGYQQGARFGAADRQDRRASNYSNSVGYLDANYGYDGNYVTQSDYNYYFREGFRRGYQDGYNSQSQYGTTTNGTVSILGTLLTSILGLQSIR